MKKYCIFPKNDMAVFIFCIGSVSDYAWVHHIYHDTFAVRHLATELGNSPFPWNTDQNKYSYQFHKQTVFKSMYTHSVL